MEERETVVDPVPCFLTACELEREESAASKGEARVHTGRLERAEQGRFVYSFIFDCASPPCRVGATTTITVFGTSYPALCLEVEGSLIRLSLRATLGQEVKSARIERAEPDVLSRVISLLKQIKDDSYPSHWNKGLAEKLLTMNGSAFEGFTELPEIIPTSGLTDDQKEAIQTALAMEVSFIWGPPGTGKTKTLGTLIAHMYRQNKRVLVLSHTNDAVDALLYAVLKEAGQNRSGSLAEASVVRLGSSVAKDLKAEFGDKIDIERVVALGQEKVLSRLEQMKKELKGIQARCFSASKGISLWKSFTDLTRELQHLRNQQRPQRSGNLSEAIRGVFSARNNQVSNDDTSESEVVSEAIALLEKNLAELEESLPRESYEELIKRSSDDSLRQVELTEAISVLETFLRDVRTEMLARARVVACTVSQAIISIKSLSDFDMIVVDEASMIPLPLLYLVAGLARQQVVIAGDFRQLPPVVRSHSQTVAQWYGRDVFDYVGIIDIVDNKQEHPSLAILSSQFRSHASVCSLINNRFYNGILKSARVESESATVEQNHSEGLFSSQRVVVVDTSSIAAWSGLQNKSKWNLENALVVRKLALILQAQGQVSAKDQLGIISPYRAQAELIQTLLEEYDADEHTTIGTVHSFQGAERSTVILDLTEGPPHRLGHFSRATSLREVGARLLNVALSRAKEQICIVGNLSYLRSQLPQRSVLGGILDEALRIGYPVSIDDLISEPLYVNPALEYGKSPGMLAFQIFDQDLISPALLTDLLDAEREVTISGNSVCPRTAAVLSTLLEERIRKGLRVTLRITVSKSKRPDAQGVLDRFRAAGVVVTYCDYPVYPMVVLDSEVVWLGSMSPLDTISGRQGRMIRCVSVVGAQRALAYIEGEQNGNSSRSKVFALAG